MANGPVRPIAQLAAHDRVGVDELRTECAPANISGFHNGLSARDQRNSARIRCTEAPSESCFRTTRPSLVSSHTCRSGSACDGRAKVAGRSPAAIRGRRAIFRIVAIDYAIGARRSQPTAGYQPTYLSCATQSRRSMTADPASHLRARLHIRRGAGHGG